MAMPSVSLTSRGSVNLTSGKSAAARRDFSDDRGLRSLPAPAPAARRDAQPERRTTSFGQLDGDGQDVVVGLPIVQVRVRRHARQYAPM